MSDTLHFLAHASTGNSHLGNQSGRELAIINYYNGASSGGFGRVFRFKDEYKEYADKMAEMQYSNVLNGYIGYSQNYRKSALRGMVAHYFGVKYRPVGAKYYILDDEGKEVDVKLDWYKLDATKLRPWFVEKESAMDCSSSVNTAFTIATGIWYHKGYSLNRAVVAYGDTRPNNTAQLSSSANIFYEDFCNGSWTPMIPVQSLWSHPYPCESETIEYKGIREVFDLDGLPEGVTEDTKIKIHKINFVLGGNNSTYTPVRNSVYKKEGNKNIVQYDLKGNRICKDLYQYRWEPFMEEYICDKDGVTLLKADYDFKGIEDDEDNENEENNENNKKELPVGIFKGYVRSDGTYLHSVQTKVGVWDNNPTVDGNSAETINYAIERKQHILDKFPLTKDLINDELLTNIDPNGYRTFILRDGFEEKNGEKYWDLEHNCSVGIRRKWSEVIIDNSNGKFEKITTRPLYYLDGYCLDNYDETLHDGDKIFKVKCKNAANEEEVIEAYFAGKSSGIPRGGCVWIREENGTVNPADIMFPMWSMKECELAPLNDEFKTFDYNGKTYMFSMSTAGTLVKVEIKSTGTCYEHWKVQEQQFEDEEKQIPKLDENGNQVYAEKNYIKTWDDNKIDQTIGENDENDQSENDGSTPEVTPQEQQNIQPVENGSNDGQMTGGIVWYVYDEFNDKFKSCANPFGEGEDKNVVSNVSEGDIPEGVMVKSVMNIIQKDDNLKRGDILITRKWSEGNTSGGHVVMYI